MGQFWSDIAVTSIGALLGAALTVVIGYLTYRLEIGRKERDAINSLIDDLYWRRAFVPIATPRHTPGASEVDDFRHATRSVRAARDNAKSTRQSLRGGSKQKTTIDGIIRACNRYLESAMVDADNHQSHLAILRSELIEAVQSLAARDPRIEALTPGEGSY